MPQYIVNLQIDGRTIVNAFGTLIALTVPSGKRIKIVRVRASMKTVSSVNATRITLSRCSDLQNTSATVTPVKKDPLSPASTTTVNVKTAGVAFVENTQVEKIDDTSFVGRGLFEWNAIDDDDCIIIDSSILNFSILHTFSTNAPEDICVTVEWIE